VSISKRTSSAFDHTEVSFNTTAPMRTAGNAVPHGNGNDDTVVSFSKQSRPPAHKPSAPDSPAVRLSEPQLPLARMGALGLESRLSHGRVHYKPLPCPSSEIHGCPGTRLAPAAS
jgi:hypothetical protein